MKVKIISICFICAFSLFILPFIELHCIAIYCIELCLIRVHGIVLHSIALHSIALHHIVLHYVLRDEESQDVAVHRKDLVSLLSSTTCILATGIHPSAMCTYCTAPVHCLMYRPPLASLLISSHLFCSPYHSSLCFSQAEDAVVERKMLKKDLVESLISMLDRTFAGSTACASMQTNVFTSQVKSSGHFFLGRYYLRQEEGVASLCTMLGFHSLFLWTD